MKIWRLLQRYAASAAAAMETMRVRAGSRVPAPDVSGSAMCIPFYAQLAVILIALAVFAVI
jgi:hypothetical protein